MNGRRARSNGIEGPMTLVAPAPQGILDPRTGQPVGADDEFFVGVNNELADKGFVITAVDDLITWARTASPIRRDDRRRHAHQQNGAGDAQGLRPDAGATLRDLDGLVRQWRRLL